MEPRKKPSSGKVTEKEESANEKGSDKEDNKPIKAKEIKFEKFKIVELDKIFDDFTNTLNPFVTNREAMEKAESSFKEAVNSFTGISPKARFKEYVEALKTKLKDANILVKIKDGVMVVYGESRRTVEAISRAVSAGNKLLAAGRGLKTMPFTMERASEDALVKAELLDVQAVLKREFTSYWDAGKIITYKRAFSKNVKMLKQAPKMVREFCQKTREIVVEMYRAFADKKEQEEMEEELEEENHEDDDGAADDESDPAEGAVGGLTKGEDKPKEKGDDKKKKPNESKNEKEELHKKLEFKAIGVQDIDRLFTDLASAINPFVVTREGIQNAKESFENCVKQICNFEGKREFKEYVKELKEKAKKGDITIYVDTSDGEIKITSVKGLEPPKMYRDAVKALNNLKAAGNDALQLEPEVQRGIITCATDIGEIDPKRDIKKGLSFRDLPKLVGKVKDLNENRKKVQQAPVIVKEFCQYVEGLITDVLEALVEGTGKKDEEMEDEADGLSGKESDDNEEEEEAKDKGGDGYQDKANVGEDEGVTE